MNLRMALPRKSWVAFLPPVLLFGSILGTGCDQGPPATPGTSSAVVTPPPPPPPPPPAETAASPSQEENSQFSESTQTAASAVAESPVERVKAEAGVGIRGRSLDPYEGVIVTPVKAFFATRERIAFVAQFQHQYDIYKAMTGEVPKDFDELKAKVLDPYQIKLPQLPPGHRYVWDAEKEELQVERPRQR
jgi:hypothetical protein